MPTALLKVPLTPFLFGFIADFNSTNKPIIPWMGGKRRLTKQILPLFGAPACYIEPFCGGAALFFNKAESKVEVLNDLNGDMVDLYRVVKHHLVEILRQLEWALVSRQECLWNQKATLKP